MIKERSLSFGKIYHRETNVSESSTFHQTNNFFLQNVIWKQQIKHMPGIHTVPETLKVCCRNFLSKNNIIRRDKKNHYIF